VGTVSNFVYNIQTHTWTRECEGENGGSTDECSATELRCGDDVQNGGEACDGDDVGICTSNQNCNSQCMCDDNPMCGDGNVDPGEACDDGNLINGDGCNDQCEDEYCGDGYADANGPDNIAGNADDEECGEPGLNCDS